MHAEARAFVERMVRRLPPRTVVVEVGSRNVNGTIRDLFAGPCMYLGTDIEPGAGVDLVIDFAEPRNLWLALKDLDHHQPDTVVCCEVLEHAPRAREIVRNALSLVTPGGYLILTCAAPGRAPHSAVDGGPLREGEYYRNVSGEDVTRWVAGAPVLIEVEEHDPRGDLYMLIRRVE